jgi:hypothetical protein
MQIAYLTMVAAGLALIGWGLPAAHKLRNPLDMLAALAVLCGLALALLGALLTVVPRFFQG